MLTVKKPDLFTIALLIGSLGAIASPTHAADWEWTFTPYLWATDIGADVSINSEPVLGTDVAFEDLFDKLDFALPLHVEGRSGKTGFFVDLNYIGLGDKHTTAAEPPLPDDTVIKSDMEQLLLEVGGFYRPSGGDHGLDVLYGVRVMDLETTFDITLPPPTNLTTKAKSSGTFTDAFVGLRYHAPLGERASIGLRGDVGAGGSDLTWNASVLLGYQVGKKRQNTLLIGYRHMEIEVEDSQGGLKVKSELTMSGPITGFMIRF